MTRLKRRELLLAMAVTSSVGFAPVISKIGRAQEKLPITPACKDGDEPTPAQTEGPYFTPNSPARWQFREPGIIGTPFILTGQVLTQGCVPIVGALVELWHANDAGEYDNQGYRLRGHLFTNATG